MSLHTISRFGENKQLLVLFIGIIILGLAAAFYLYTHDKHSLVYYGDSVSHLVISRKIADWADPGLHQIGTVWLPLPHILFLPFSIVNPLFTTGFAGMIVGLPSLALTTLFLFRIIKNEVGLSYIAFVGALLYATNPNIVYLGLTAMTESLFMLFFVGSAYFFQKWYYSYQNENSDKLHELPDLLKCSFFIVLATLCRYEVWILSIFLVAFIFLLVLKKKKKKRQQQGQGKNIDTKYMIGVITISILSFSGIAIWLVWNMYHYGSALEFASSKYYSAASQALTRPYRQGLLLQPLNVMNVYGNTALAIYGYVILIAAAIGFITTIIIFRKGRFDNKSDNDHSNNNERGKGPTAALSITAARRKPHFYFYLYLALPSIFTIFSLIAGIGEMSFWFNSRFLILLAPLIVIFVSISLKELSEITIKKIRKRSIYRLIMAGTVGVLFIYNIVLPGLGVVTFIDARKGFLYRQTPFAVQTGEVLGSKYNGTGTIMLITGSAQDHRIMLSSGILLRQFEQVRDYNMWKDSFKEPWSHVKWLVISKESNSDALNAAKYWLARQDQLNQYFDTLFENKYYEIMLRKPTNY